VCRGTNGVKAMSSETESRRSSLVRFHQNVLDNYKKLLDEQFRKKTGVSNEELSYNLFVHSGMLFRYTGDIRFVNFLTSLDLDYYFEYAFRYISELRIVSALKSYIGLTNVCDYDLFRIESLIGIRDELQAFDLAASIIIKRDAASGIYKWLSQLTDVRVYTNDFDILARTDEHLMSLACIDFFPQKNCVVIDYRKEDYWWLDMYDTYQSTSRSILNDAARVKKTEELDAEIATSNETLKSIIVQFAPDFIAVAIKTPALPAAAASNTPMSSVLEWDGVSNSRDILAKENAVAYSTNHFLYAELVTPITSQEGGQAYAEWVIRGKSPGYRENTSFFLLENKTGKVLGTGFIDKEGYASLGNASWKELKAYKNNNGYADLTLLVINRN